MKLILKLAFIAGLLAALPAAPAKAATDPYHVVTYTQAQSVCVSMAALAADANRYLVSTDGKFHPELTYQAYAYLSTKYPQWHQGDVVAAMKMAATEPITSDSEMIRAYVNGNCLKYFHQQLKVIED